ncbi:hypothetical protein MKQ68_11075 [Chitinophaga horti]|uniref:DUF4249 domain-containing protein n=1 Tax=Chitinophaga horti TaxID=2920382 RepID=A0ABY6J7I2_9BACT|nr:hypothetical protein [Chitinophaga horti]UYQ95644.1 hypothetical protein MKQ68_11075 [Chitinophaga horti]
MKKLQLLLSAAFLMGVSACSKVDYTEIERPAYLRVFNDMNFKIYLANKDEQIPFLTMLIDPVVDKDGLVTGAAITGDFLTQRDTYAPPYPSHVGESVTVNNPEYPGKESVLVGPVLNGFDLSSWAQIPSGEHRIMFCIRPTNSIPFFQLEDKLRKTIMIDTVLTLNEREVYTMHVFQKNFVTKENTVLLREENFHKLPLSDSLVYVNFYNYSAEGYWQADKSLKEGAGSHEQGVMRYGVRDDMNIWMSLSKPYTYTTLPGYHFNYFANVKRSYSSAVAPYHSFPLFADTTSDRISTDFMTLFSLLQPGVSPEQMPYGNYESDVAGTYGFLGCYGNGQFTGNLDLRGVLKMPGLNINIHSGTYNPRTFATINTIEIINGRAYLTTVQRRYAAPIY